MGTGWEELDELPPLLLRGEAVEEWGRRIVGESHIGFAHAEAEDDEAPTPHEQLVVVELLLPPPPPPLRLRLRLLTTVAGGSADGGSLSSKASSIPKISSHRSSSLVGASSGVDGSCTGVEGLLVLVLLLPAFAVDDDDAFLAGVW